MEGTRKPGYYASVTGRRPPGEPRRRPGPGEPLRGPEALYGEVHRYGPRSGGGLFQKIEVAWKSEEHPVPEDVMSARWMQIMDRLMKDAEKEADRLTNLDPEAKGLGK